MADAYPENAQIWGPAVSVAVIFVANVVTYALNPNSWLYRHALARCGIPRLFFASNRADHVDKRALPRTYWAFDVLEPAHVVQSYILSTPLLLVLHFLTFCYFLITVIVDVVIEYYIVNRNRGPYGGWVTFLTNWSITLLGLAGLVAFIDTARHIRRERHARKCLKAAQQRSTLQERTPSQMGNIEGTSVISAWRDYEHASRTSSIPRPDQTSQMRTVRAVTPNGSKPVSSSPKVMPSPSPDRLLHTAHPSGARDTIRPAIGIPAEAQAGGNTTHSPVTVSRAAVKQFLNTAAQGPTNYHENFDHDVQPHQQQAIVQLVNRHPHTPDQYHNTDANLPPAVSPISDNAGEEPFAGTRNGHYNKQHHAGIDASPVERDAMHRRVYSNGSNGTTTVGDTVVEVGNGEYSCKPSIKGIDEWDWLSGAHCILMETATTAAFFVSFWYWVGIVVIANGGSVTLNGGTLMAHAGNVAIALLQIILTRQPIVSVHFQVLLWYATLYEIFVWIYGELSGIWRYSLHWQEDKAAGVFALIPVVTFIMFLLWYIAAVIRERAFIPATQKVVQHHKNKHGGDHAEGHAADV